MCFENVRNVVLTFAVDCRALKPNYLSLYHFLCHGQVGEGEKMGDISSQLFVLKVSEIRRQCVLWPGGGRGEDGSSPVCCGALPPARSDFHRRGGLPVVAAL